MKASLMESIITSLRPFYQKAVPKSVRHSIATARGRLAQNNLRTLNAAIKKKLGQNVASVRLSHGDFLVDLRDLGVGLPTFITREYEALECDFLRRVVKPGMVAYDIGANIGIMMGLLSKLTSASGQVIGFEPDAYNHSLAKQNIERNSLTNATLFNCALGSEEGTLHVYKSSSNFGDHRVYKADDRSEGHEIAVHKLATLIDQNQLRSPDFIKMDVQGYEIEVLKGMSEVLARPGALTLLTEYWPHGLKAAGSDPLEMRRLMSNLGFRSYRIKEDTNLEELDWDQLDRELAKITDTDNCYANLVFQK